MNHLEALEPYCPLCQVGFTSQYHEAYKLVCNHLICQYCLDKIRLEQGELCCYFDGTKTFPGCEMPLRGLREFLVESIVTVQSLTLNTAATELDKKLEQLFNLMYERAKIPCRTQDCRNPKCHYNHNNLFYKKSPCPFTDSCPNASSCIFTHPHDTSLQESKLIDIPLPIVKARSTEDSVTLQASRSRADQSPYTPHSQTDPQSPATASNFYDVTQTMNRSAANHTIHYVAEQPLQGPSASWVCSNCQQWASGQVCSQCSLFYRS